MPNQVNITTKPKLHSRQVSQKIKIVDNQVCSILGTLSAAKNAAVVSKCTDFNDDILDMGYRIAKDEKRFCQFNRIYS